MTGRPPRKTPSIAPKPLHARTYDLLWQAGWRAGTCSRHPAQGHRLGRAPRCQRTPVREAFRKLAHDGVLDPLGARRLSGASLRGLGDRGVYRRRAALEALAAPSKPRNAAAWRWPRRLLPTSPRRRRRCRATTW